VYQKPQVKEVQPSRVEGVREVTGNEAEAILQKYGYNNSSSTIKEKPNKKMTFEEMLELQNAKEKQKKESKPATFRSDGYYSETKYGTEEESGYGFKIEIRSDMKIPKY
jgi:hypothetical protein